MPPKRKLGAPAKSPPAKQGRVDAGNAMSLELDKAISDTDAPNYYHAVLAKFDTAIATHGSLDRYLHSIMPTDAHRADFAILIDEFFPPLPGVEYAAHLRTPGPVNLRPWQLGWDVQLGNKGIMVADDARVLVSLIALRGFRTDAERLPGVEKLSVEAASSLHPRFGAADGYSVVPHANLEAGVGSAGYTKGWFRSCCFLFVLATILEEDLIPNVMARPEIAESFQRVCAIVNVFDTVDQRVNATREITLSSVLTRRRPNCFTWMFQIRKLMATGLSAEATVASWSQASAVSAILAISTDEAKAALNLVSGCSEDFVNAMKALAEKYGMSKGPVAHSLLASPLVCLNNGPPHMSTIWENGLKNTNHTLAMLALRLQSDWENMPRAMRKVATPADLALLQPRCGAFAFLVRLLQAEISADHFHRELPALEVRFGLKYLDMEIDDEIRRSGTPDLDRVSAFKSILATYNKESEQARGKQHQELSDRVALATFEQMQAELTGDWAEMERYTNALLVTTRHQETDLLKFRQRRYQHGLERIDCMMEERMAICSLDNMNLSPQHFASTRLKLAAVRTAAAGKFMALLVLDATVYHNAEVLEGVMVNAASILHQDAGYGMFVLMPQHHKSLSSETVLKHTRLIEDRLMAHNLELGGGDIAVNYHVPDEHGNDRRRLSQKARLVHSKVFGTGALWQNSDAARGTIGPLPLLRVKDMISPGTEPGDSDRKLSPGNRLLQRGPEAVKIMIEQLVAGLGLTRGDKLMIVDFVPGWYSEWSAATWAAQKSHGHDVLFAYCGFHVDQKEFKSVSSRVKGMLMDEWWDLQPEAGSPTQTC